MTMRVLIADDDQSMRQLIARSLSAFGATETVEAVDGAEALAKLDEDLDLIILDWHMPVVDGLNVVKSIRKQGLEIPILMVTAETEKPLVVEAIQAGVDDYLAKPFSQDTFRAKIARFCGFGIDTGKTALYRAGTAMDCNPITVRPHTTVAEAAALLLKHHISGMAVVDTQGRPLGMITEFHLIRVICRPDINELAVSELMTTDVMTVREDTILSDVVNLMEENRIRRIPVVRNGVVVGVIARRDLLQYVMDNQEALREFLDTVAATAQT
jgi:two-component system chemotaxis response regulator CheY